MLGFLIFGEIQSRWKFSQVQIFFVKFFGISQVFVWRDKFLNMKTHYLVRNYDVDNFFFAPTILI